MPDPFAITDARLTLWRTPAVLREMLHGLPKPVVERPYAPRAFSAYNVVGHLIIGERQDWIPRLRIILQHGEARPFDPFPHDSTLDPAQGRPLDDLLEEFAELRAQNLDVLDAMHLSEDQLDLTGTHPTLGRVTVRELIATWAAHDLHHTAQVCKALVGRLADRVGPWQPYVGIFSILRSPAQLA